MAASKDPNIMNRSSTAITAEMSDVLSRIFSKKRYGPKSQQEQQFPGSNLSSVQETTDSSPQTAKDGSETTYLSSPKSRPQAYTFKRPESRLHQPKSPTLDRATQDNNPYGGRMSSGKRSRNGIGTARDSISNIPATSAFGTHERFPSRNGQRLNAVQTYRTRPGTRHIDPYDPDHRGLAVGFITPSTTRSIVSRGTTSSISTRVKATTRSAMNGSDSTRSSLAVQEGGFPVPPTARGSEPQSSLSSIREPVRKNKVLTCDDVVAFHKQNGDYDRQRRMYGSEYHEWLLEHATPAQKAAYAKANAMKKGPEPSPVMPKVGPQSRVPGTTKMSIEPVDTHSLQYPEAAGRFTYPVPKLGTDSMPKLELRDFGLWEKFSKQIERHLDEKHLRNVPPPAYPFSQKTKESLPDPAMTGALPAPARDSNLPLTNAFDPTSSVALRYQGPKQGSGRTPTEFGDEDLPPAKSNIVHESVPVASRWAWFVKPLLSTCDADADNLQERVVNQQLSAQYDHRVNADCWKYDEHGSLLWDCDDVDLAHVRIRLIDEWMIRQFVNTVAQPFCWDMTSEGFRSGDLPCPGVAYDYQEFPSDLGYEPTAYYYGPINWDVIPSPKLDQLEYLDNKYFNQTSHSIIDQQISRAIEQSRDHIEAMRIKNQIRAQRQANKDAQANAIAEIDTSQQSWAVNPYTVQGKIYIRPLSSDDDVKTMHYICNYYVIRTNDAPEIEKVKLTTFFDIIHKSGNENYPILVAVLRVEPGDPPVARSFVGARFDGSEGPTEHVVGFALCSPWSTTGAHGFAEIASIQVFVSPQHIGRKIATNLLDRTIGCIDNDYQSKQGANIVVPSTGPAWNRGWREPQTICMRWFFDDMNLPYNKGRKAYLEEHFGFVETGRLVGALSKDGNRTRYSMVTMQREANRLPKKRVDDTSGIIW